LGRLANTRHEGARFNAGNKRAVALTYAIFKAVEEVVNGAAGPFERGKLFVGWIFVSVFFKSTSSFCRCFH